MIVNWKKEKAGVLVLPCMQNGKCAKKIHILPGHNDVPEKDWLMARDSALRHMEKGYIVEIIKVFKILPFKIWCKSRYCCIWKSY